MSRGKEQAFPVPWPEGPPALGMTLREHFAGQALVGYLSGIIATDIPDSYTDEPEAWKQHTVAVGILCRDYADGLLAALEAKKP